IYKEYSDSAWNLWRGSQTPSVAAFVNSPAADIVARLKVAHEAAKKFKTEEAAALAAAEESGEELATELRQSCWRFSVPGLAMGGDSVDAAEHDIKVNILNYDGPLQSLAPRSSECARVQFGGEKADTYFGGYVDDLKEGPGVYVFAAGAFYVGTFKGGKREGRGVMLLPDGGLYEGELVADKFHGQGQYRYPDGSVYTGTWAAGAKHGPGVYWDTLKGCLRGSWSKGTLVGPAVYDQPAVHFEGEFVAGVPAGPGQFTLTSHRTLDMDKFAAAHIMDSGPTLRGKCEYAIPPGSGDEPKLDEEGAPIEDPDKPPLPAFPAYEGLTFRSTALPQSIADFEFPPAQGLPVPVPGVQRFRVPDGLGELVEDFATGYTGVEVTAATVGLPLYVA
ncbi:flagellar radial spoke protein 1, partial [Haematococcus lacustris]